MDMLLQDARYSARTLLKSPGYSLVAIITLALGIGATSAVFSVVNAVLLRSLPFTDHDRLVMVYESREGEEGDLSIPDYFDYQEQNNVFEGMCVYLSEDFNVLGTGKPEIIHGELVSANFFSVLGVKPSLGRTFVPGEDRANGGRAVVISHGLWKRRGSDKNILGKNLIINGASFAIIGVTGPNFQPLNPDAELWIPIDLDGSDRLRLPVALPHNDIKMRKLRLFSSIARLKPGVTVEQARAEVETIGRRLEREYPDTNTKWTGGVYLLQERIVRNVKSSLLVLFCAVGFVLLITCANVANLNLVRTITRQKEIAIRTALGASPARVIRQLLTESTVLSLIGGALGLTLASLCLKFLFTMSAKTIPRLAEIDMDGRVLGFTFAISILAGLIFGIAPALHVAKPNLQEVLKEGRTSGMGASGKYRVQSIFVVSEISLALVLLIGAGLMVKSLSHLQEVNPGFNPNGLLTMKVALPKATYTDEQQQTAFFKRLLDQMQSMPGVEHASLANYLPATGEGLMVSFLVEGRAPLTPGEKNYASYGLVSADYFRAMSIPLRKGRYFIDQDNETAPHVVIINENMARHYWPGEDPVGKHIILPIWTSAPISAEVVGIVGDVKQFGLNTNSGAQIYEPYLQRPSGIMRLVLKTASDPAAVIPSAMRELMSLDKDLPVSRVMTMQQILYNSVAQPRFLMLLLSIFAGVALTLAVIGIFGVMAYSVTQRRHEIAIRMALGAQQNAILRLILSKALSLTLGGIVIGLCTAFAMTRLMSSLLFGLSATDPIIFISTSALLGAVALIACYIPAHKAAKTDPRVVLSTE